MKISQHGARICMIGKVTHFTIWIEIDLFKKLMINEA
ncbi:hypothetical protein EV690_3399 [Celerinatantimonas diazotrophica]|uniref:Uncharacterized protein n=1 Tax=Celerinatantimonas diazotrophica TaxID=412034 RepID=A0A4V2PNE9_9GAMM|nr:hypothetical protein EV690_3399 [Celerinatantimonas diazotrophica]CAG9295514.1 hypothetical protein CEDIAZO_00630 [Celerinatantimonas diazotrophica]